MILDFGPMVMFLKLPGETVVSDSKIDSEDSHGQSNPVLELHSVDHLELHLEGKDYIFGRMKQRFEPFTSA